MGLISTLPGIIICTLKSLKNVIMNDFVLFSVIYITQIQICKKCRTIDSFLKLPVSFLRMSLSDTFTCVLHGDQ